MDFEDFTYGQSPTPDNDGEDARRAEDSFRLTYDDSRLTYDEFIRRVRRRAKGPNAGQIYAPIAERDDALAVLYWIVRGCLPGYIDKTVNHISGRGKGMLEYPKWMSTATDGIAKKDTKYLRTLYHVATAYPEDIRDVIVQEWAGIAHNVGGKQADLWLRATAKDLPPLPDMDDTNINVLAHLLAKNRIPKRLEGKHDIPKEWRDDGTIDQPAKFIVRWSKKVREDIERRLGVNPETNPRWECERWWRRWLRRWWRQGMEIQMLEWSLVGSNRRKVSDRALRDSELTDLRNCEILMQREVRFNGSAPSDDDDPKGITDNSEQRAAELLHRSTSFGEIIEKRGWRAFAFTLTCPSRMHPSSPKWDGTTPNEAHAHLMDGWRRMRARIHHHGKPGFDWIAIRSVEPHSDACPHMHGVIAASPEMLEVIAEEMEDIFLLECDPEENGAKQHRIKIDWLKEDADQAVRYAVKYGLKSVMPPENHKTKKHRIAAEEHRAWCRAWGGIRSFAFVGMPPVTLWREAKSKMYDKADLPIVAAATNTNHTEFYFEWLALGGRKGIESIHELRMNRYEEAIRRCVGHAIKRGATLTKRVKWAVIWQKFDKGWRVVAGEANTCLEVTKAPAPNPAWDTPPPRNDDVMPGSIDDFFSAGQTRKAA